MVVSGSATTVSVGGKAAFVYSQSVAAQLAVELPIDVPTGPTTMTVTAGGQTSAAFALTISAYAPALASADGSGSGIGLLYDSAFEQITAANQATPGQALIAYATGLGATNPVVPTGTAPTGPAQATATVTVSVAGEKKTAAFAGEGPTTADGYYQVNFTVPMDATGCDTGLVLSVGGISSPPVSVPIKTPKATLCAAENAATGLVRDATHGAAANSFLAIYAANLGGASANNLYPASSSQGIQVTYNGTPLPLYSITPLPPSQTLVNTALPANAGSSGTGTLTVTNSAGASQSYTIALAPADLGVFRLPDPHDAARVQGVVLLANSYWFAMPASLAPSYNLPACTGLAATSPCGQPAHPGDNIVIYLTGGGLATPNGDPNGTPLALGSVAPADGSVIYKTVAQPTITIGGISASPAFSGIAPGTAAEYQINTTIPAGVQPGDDVPIVISMSGSKDTITIAVAAQ